MVGDELLSDQELRSYLSGPEKKTKYDMIQEANAAVRSTRFSFSLSVSLTRLRCARQARDPAAVGSKVSEVSMNSRSDSSNDSGLQVYYCAFCGSFALIIGTNLRGATFALYLIVSTASSFHDAPIKSTDTVLEYMPRRQTDHSFVVEERKYAVKKNLVAGPTKLIKRYVVRSFFMILQSHFGL